MNHRNPWYPSSPRAAEGVSGEPARMPAPRSPAWLAAGALIAVSMLAPQVAAQTSRYCETTPLCSGEAKGEGIPPRDQCIAECQRDMANALAKAEQERLTRLSEIEAERVRTDAVLAFEAKMNARLQQAARDARVKEGRGAGTAAPVELFGTTWDCDLGNRDEYIFSFWTRTSALTQEALADGRLRGGNEGLGSWYGSEDAYRRRSPGGHVRFSQTGNRVTLSHAVPMPGRFTDANSIELTWMDPETGRTWVGHCRRIQDAH